MRYVIYYGLCYNDDENVLHDRDYYVSSLDPQRVTTAELLQYVRQHWRIEKGLHFLKTAGGMKIVTTPDGLVFVHA